MNKQHIIRFLTTGFFGVFIACGGGPKNGFAVTDQQQVPSAPGLTTKDIFEKIKTFLRFQTFQAQFLQETPDGAQEGTLSIKKGGKMRLEYAPPCPLLLIAKDGWLTQYNTQTGDKEQLLVEDTPAAFLLHTETDFDEKFSIKKWHQTPGLLTVQIESDALENVDSTLTIVFETQPFALKQWVIEDSTGYQTKVTLFNWAVDAPVAEKIFKI